MMLARFKKLRARELPLHRAIISDIILWVMLALLLAWAVYWFAIFLPEKNGQTILLKFKDANQVTKGSAVTMLGTDVGYVKNIHLHQDHVDVLVQTYSKSLVIPSGATFTVLFNGLAGSKSIDIEVPKMPLPQIEGHPIYTVAEPVRLKTLLDYSVDMTQALTAGAQNIADFFGKKKPVEELQFNIHQAHQWTLDTLTYSGAIESDMRTLKQDLTFNVKEGHSTLTAFSRKAALFAEQTDPTKVRPMVISALTSIQNIRNTFIPSDGSPSIQNRVKQWNQTSTQIGSWARLTNIQISNFDLARALDKIEAGEDRFIAALDQIQAFFEKNDKQALQQLRLNIQAFNRQVLVLSFKLDPNQPNPALLPKNQAPTCTPIPHPPHRIPMKPPRPSSAGAIETFPIVDRNGSTQKHTNTWWDHYPSAKKALAGKANPYPGYVKPNAEGEKDAAFYLPLLNSISDFCVRAWDGLTALFTG